jgi:alkylation response protein AidB-like acyl-CoA dehydrogenase
MSIEVAVDGEAIRDEVARWLQDNPWRGVTRAAWLRRVADARWAGPTWPVEWYGRGWTAAQAQVVIDQFAAVGAPGAGQDRFNLVANTVLAFGDDAVKRRFILPLLTEQVSVCLLYSEPGAGSDLAGLQTTAERNGDDWVVNGQKVWTSGAHQADYGMLVARTDWDVPKHRGLTFFVFPMRQAGVEVRPITQITGERHFNEVFITDARVPDANRLGEVGAGWRVLQTALAYERLVMSNDNRAPGRSTDGRRSEDPVWGTSPDLVRLAIQEHRTDDPLLRQALARAYTLRMVNRWNARRMAALLEQGTSSPLSSLAKLMMSRIVHSEARVQAQIIGAQALLSGEMHPAGDSATFQALNAYFTSIGGGTDQIQRNIVGERLLGLPKEPDVDRDVPFRLVRRSTSETRRPR